MEYRRIETLDNFDDQLVAIKSLHERIALMLNSFFDVEPKILAVRNKDEEIRRCWLPRLLLFSFSFVSHVNLVASLSLFRYLEEPEKALCL